MKVVCFGDSNTFGYDPRLYLGGRYDAEFRWVDVLAAITGWEVHNNGMNGREIPRQETIFPRSMNLLIVMLGTNDLLQGNSADQVARRMKAFLDRLSFEKNRTLLVAPPPMQPGDWVSDQCLINASKVLAKHYREIAEEIGVNFADAGVWDVSLAFDGVHFTEDGHIAFAKGLCNYLSEHMCFKFE